MIKIAKSYFKVFLWGGEPQNFLFTSKEFQAARVWKPLISPVWWLNSYDWPFSYSFKSHIYTTGTQANWWLCSVCCGHHWLGYSIVEFPNHVSYCIHNKNRLITKYFLLFIHHNVSHRTSFITSFPH